jgi:hypothetical protein
MKRDGKPGEHSEMAGQEPVLLVTLLLVGLFSQEKIFCQRVFIAPGWPESKR